MDGETTGRLLGPYRIEARLGAGGMGEVFRGTDTRLGRAVAVKTCREGFDERFRREAKAIAALNHPHVCTLYDVGPDYLVMELIEGETLAARLERGKLPLKQALEYGRQIAEALAAAHSKEIVHRDLKPGNVMSGRSGIKVLDFGLARHTRDETITMGHGLVGTPAYMAPEQMEGREADARTDIYALGLVLREMLTGKRQGSTKELPERVAHVVDGCLEADPEERWQAAADVARELAWAAESPASVAGRSEARGRWLWAAAALAMAGALAMAAAGLWRRAHEVPAGQPVRISVPLVRVNAGTMRMGGTLLHREQPGVLMALSPDGTRLVAQVLDQAGEGDANGAREGTVRLATRRLDEAELTPIPGTEGPTGPFFSPDGEWIAFFGSGKLRKIPVHGGAPETLCEAGNFPSGSWGDDGNIIAALEVHGGLYRVPGGGGRPAAVTTLKAGEVMHRWPQVLPGSRAALFTSYKGGGPEDASIEALVLATGERKPVLQGAAMGRYVKAGDGAGYLVYLREHRLYAAQFDAGRLAVRGTARAVADDVSSITLSTPGDFATSDNGTLVYLGGASEPGRAIFRLEENGRKEVLRAAPGLYNGLRFSPDGRRLAFGQGDPLKQQDLWVEDLETNALTRITRSAGSSDSPVWWPDGKHILFTAMNQPDAGLYRARADGSEPQLVLGGDWVAVSSVSPDGRYVMVESGNPITGAAVDVLEVRETAEGLKVEKRTPYLRVPGFPRPVISPDGHWVAYSSAENGPQEDVYVQPFPGPGERVAVAGGGLFPTWSRDGKELFFYADNHLMAVECETRAGVFTAGKPRVWGKQATLDTGGPYEPFAMAPNGKAFAVLLYPDGGTETRGRFQLTYILHFAEMLR